MSKIPGSQKTIELLVNCKTYPAISTKYFETVCTGGVQASGEFVRLYPVPFRLLPTSEQYDRWDLIQVHAYKDTKDTRPESWHLAPEHPIVKLAHISSARQRWQWMKKAVFQSAAEMESKGLTNGCVEINPIDLYWKADAKQWSQNQLNELLQKNLFYSEEYRVSAAEKVPWQFRIKYEEKSTGRIGDCKILAWSLYTGYLRQKNNGRSDDDALEAVANVVRKSIFNKDRTTFAILGTHSLSGHWMVSALYHVPKKIASIESRKQGELF